MKSSKKRYPNLILLALSLLIGSCTLQAADKPPRVVASIKPIHSILSGLMSGAGQPELLVPEGELPYGYRLTESQRTALLSADLLVWIGPELETFLRPLLPRVKARTRIESLLENPGIKVLPSRWDRKRRDPHIWLDSRNVVILVDELARLLSQIDPERAALYGENRKKLKARMSELDRRLEYGYRGLQGGVAIAYYDTLQYFEQAYALKIDEAISAYPGGATATEKLLRGRSRLASGEAGCLLTEAGMAMPQLSLLTNDLDITVAELDSFGTGLSPGGELYFELMAHNTRVIKACLGGDPVEGGGVAQVSEPIGSTISTTGGKFMLMDHHGGLVTEQDLLGKFQLLYFGYTFCPDICPTSLQVLSQALDGLGAKADRIQPYFITIDPERDSVEVMKRYVGYFNDRLIGLTGSKQMTERVAQQFKVRFEKVLEEGRDPDLYAMDHSASLYLMAPDGRFLAKFAHGISARQLMDKLSDYIR